MKLAGITRRPRARNVSEMEGAIARFGMKGHVAIDVVGPDGVVKMHREHVANILNTFGLNRLCELIATGGEASDWVAAYRIGTDTTAAASNDASLNSSVGLAVLSNTDQMSVVDAGNLTAQYRMTFASDNPAGAAEIHEVGLFCNSTANSQLAARAVLGTASVNKGASDEIRISHSIVFTTA